MPALETVLKGRSVPSAPPSLLSSTDFTCLAGLEHTRLDQEEGTSAPGHCGAATSGLDRAIHSCGRKIKFSLTEAFGGGAGGIF